MEELPNIDIENMCRACFLNDTSTKSMISTDSTVSEPLLDMFASLLHIEVESVKTLSTQICNSCETKLKLAYNFQQQCRESSKKFEEYSKVKKNQIEFVSFDVELSSNSEVKCEPEVGAEENSETVVKKYITRRVRLEQFSHIEVAEAIKELKKSFLQNVECIKCGFIGSNSRSLSVHMSHLHKELKNRWCVECNKEYDDLTEHLQSHENGVLQCRFCKKKFGNKSHLIEHLSSHSVTQRFNCDICRKSFASVRRLRTHFRLHSNEKPYKCSFCPKSFIHIYLLKNHLKKLHSTYKCNLCAQKFDNNQSLNAHLKKHLNVDNFCVNCNVVIEKDCEHICANPDVVKEEAIEEKPTETITDNILLAAQNFCTICNRRVSSLPLHIEKFHTTSKSDPLHDKKHLCPVCGKHFKASNKLGIHMRIHTGELPYECSFCNKRMITRGALITHERSHTGEKPHICHVCGKGFAQSSVLNTHMKLHTGRTEVCNICNKGFCRPSELRLHMRKHTGERPFLCTECGQAFAQRSHLVEHGITHSDLRAYKCTYCEKAFKQSCTLKSHILIHLGQKPYKCTQCSYASRQNNQLTEHMKTHAEDLPNPDCPHVCTICFRRFSTFAMLTSHRQIIHCISSDPELISS